MAAFATSGALEIAYKGKMFEKPKCEFIVQHTVPEGDSEEETKLLRAAYAKLYDGGLKKLQKERGAVFAKAMIDTEKAMEKKKLSKDEMEKFVATANQMIKQGLKTFEQQVQALATQVMEQVYDYVEKKIKKKLNRKKVMVGLKITGLILITLTVAALSIAVSVLTAGAATPVAIVAIGAVITGVGALIASGKTIKKEVDGYKGVLDKIQKDVEAIDKAVAYQEKKKSAAEFRKLGPKEKVKLLMSGTSGHVKSLKKHLEDAEGRMILMRKHMHQAMVDVSEAEENADKFAKGAGSEVQGDAEQLRKLVLASKYKLQKFEDKKKEFDDLKAEAKRCMSDLETKGLWDGGNLSKALRTIDDHQETVMFLIKSTATIFTLSKKIHKAVTP